LAKRGHDIDYAARLLTEGQVVGIPTETVYGLGANCYDSKAIAHVFEVKNRPSFDPLIAHTTDIHRAGTFVSEIPDVAYRLAEKFWPGPLTFVLRKKKQVPDIVTSGLDTVAVRVPDHPMTLQLLSTVDFPVAAPSANPFGYISPTNADHVEAQLGGKIPYILDGGDCRVGVESTIIRFEKDKPVVLRLGGIAVEDIKALAGAVEMALNAGARPEAPGMLASHYAPHTRVLTGSPDKLLREYGDVGTGILAFDREIPGAGKAVQFLLSPSSDLEEAATRLFSGLRYLDQLNLQRIICVPVPDKGLGRAINDRLKRASMRID
jgi:L-threonylcarbamoyladenylate synthase